MEEVEVEGGEFQCPPQNSPSHRITSRKSIHIARSTHTSPAFLRILWFTNVYALSISFLG